jgi:hypothetical protein
LPDEPPTPVTPAKEVGEFDRFLAGDKDDPQKRDDEPQWI